MGRTDEDAADLGALPSVWQAPAAMWTATQARSAGTYLQPIGAEGWRAGGHVPGFIPIPRASPGGTILTPAIRKAAAPVPIWRDLHALADAAEPDIRRKILRAVAETLKATDWMTVRAALSANDLERASAAIPWVDVGEQFIREELPPALLQLFEDTGAMLAEKLPQGLSVSFDMTNPRAVEWAATYAGDLVVQISEPTRLAIRSVIEAGFTDGVEVATMAKQLRGLVGLTEQQAGAVLRYYDSLIEAGTGTEANAWTRAERYAGRLLRQRAETIARTETMNAANEGQQELWLQLQDAGLIAGSVKRKWIVTPDDALCPICESLGRLAPVGLTEPFRITSPVPLSVMTPTAHPRCRCAVALADQGQRAAKRWAPIERLYAVI